MPRRADPVVPLTAAQRELAADPENLKLARDIADWMARKCRRAAEEIECAALFGLVSAAAKFDPARGPRFRTFARQCIRCAILEEARQQLPRGFRRRRVGAPGTVLLSMGSGRNLEPEPAVLADDRAVGWELDAVDTVHGLTRRFRSSQAAVIRAYFTRPGATMRALSAECGVCESRVSQMIRLALEELRDGLPDDYRYP